MKLIWIFVSIGGFVGSYLPVIFGVSAFSLWGVLGGGIGSIAGIWLYNRLDIY